MPQNKKRGSGHASAQAADGTPVTDDSAASNAHAAPARANETSVTDAAASVFVSYPVLSFWAATLLWSATWWSAVSRLFFSNENVMRNPQMNRLAHLLASIGMLGPTIAGVMLTLLAEGEAGVNRIARGFVKRVPLLAIAMCALPWITHAVVYYLWQSSELGVKNVADMWGPEQWFRLQRGWVAGIASCVQEDIGWRMFVLPHLLRQFPAHRAALLVGFMWAVWHALPTAFALESAGPRYAVAATPIPIASLSLVPFAIMHVGVFVFSRGSLAASMLFSVMLTWSAVVFEGPLVDDTPVTRSYYSVMLILIANVVAFPVYLTLQRMGTKHARRGELASVSAMEPPPTEHDTARADVSEPVEADSAPHIPARSDASGSSVRRRKHA